MRGPRNAFSSLCAPGACFHEELFSTSGGGRIRIVHFTAALKKRKQRIIFVPGWVTQPQAWAEVMKRITEESDVLYVETREKTSAVLESGDPVSIESMAADLRKLFSERVSPDDDPVIAGSSLGATLIAHTAPDLHPPPSALVLIAPNAEFSAPCIWRILVRATPPGLVRALLPLVKWYLKNFRLNIEKDPDQYEKYASAIDAAEPGRLKKAASSLLDYTLWDRLELITSRCLIIGGAHDRLHDPAHLKIMANRIPRARYIDMGTNRATHSTEMVDHLYAFLDEHTGEDGTQ